MKMSGDEAMFLNGKVSHIGPNGNSLTDRIIQVGFQYTKVAENAAPAMDIKTVFGMLFNEPPGADGHRQNILDPSYNFMGVGGNDMSEVHSGSWIQNFAASTSEKCIEMKKASPPPTPPPAPKPEVKPIASNKPVAADKPKSPALVPVPAPSPKPTPAPVAQTPIG